MSIRSDSTVKRRNLPELETVVSSSVAEVVRIEVKWTIGVKRAKDEKGDSSESKRGDEDTNIVYICNVKLATTSIHENKNHEFLYKILQPRKFSPQII